MGDLEESCREETAYLENTLDFIKGEIAKQNNVLSSRLHNLIMSNRSMWDDSAHYVNDFEKLTDMNQHLSEVTTQAIGYGSVERQIEKYKRMLGTPYFGRFDFSEDGSEDREKIYVGLYNLMDPDTYDVLVYDWRSPISSIFYRSEPGKASYNAPGGEVSGQVLLKRQYKIQDSILKYFFDCSIRIGDEILQEVLGRNSSPKMRSIVETIQREQDIIIRDLDNELLIVQGVAGSGKTSIALHRIAFLLYEGLNSHINSNNIVIISPSAVFSRYISDVLPELGEENVERVTFDELAVQLLGEGLNPETRYTQLESLVSHNDMEDDMLKRESIEFKGSGIFVEILNRFIRYFEHRMIKFEDVYFNGVTVETGRQLKNIFLNNKIGVPASKRLKRIENMILDKVHPLQKDMYRKIEPIVLKSVGHDLEIKSFSRLLAIKRTGKLMEQLHKFTEFDCLKLYKGLFNDAKLFYRLAEGLSLPANIEAIISRTRDRLNSGQIDYEDCSALLYIKVRLEGCDKFSGIKHVVVDEAQDYYPMQYEIFNLLFKSARYTVLGDLNQSIEKQGDVSLYDEIVKIFNKNKSVKLFLNKSYRSSLEINRFTQKLLGKNIDFASFDRHETEPAVFSRDSEDAIDESIIKDVNRFCGQGYESIAIICKSRSEAEHVYERLKNHIKVRLVSFEDSIIEKGVSVIPAYLVKGLEFDAVFVYNGSDENYFSRFDRNLLYIACTRALHRLAVYYTGPKSRFL